MSAVNILDESDGQIHMPSDNEESGGLGINAGDIFGVCECRTEGMCSVQEISSTCCFALRCE